MSFPSSWIGAIQDRLIVLFLALMLSLLLGGPRSLHVFLGLHKPGEAWRNYLYRTGKKLNRAGRSAGTRRMRGLILTLFALGVSIGLGLLIHRLSRPEEREIGSFGAATEGWFFVIEVLLLASILPLRQLGEQAGEVKTLLLQKKLDLARQRFATLARRDPETLDRHTLCRAAIEAMAEHFADAVIAPVFWYLFLGLPGAFAVAVINMLDRMFGHRDREKAVFGSIPAALDDFLQAIPARLAVIYLLGGSFLVPKASPAAGLRESFSKGVQFASPNAGLPISAVAGALGITLGGPRRIFGETVTDPWTGLGTARLEPGDIRRAQLAYALAAGLLCLSIGALNLL